jgi:hypothetical protein
MREVPITRLQGIFNPQTDMTLANSDEIPDGRASCRPSHDRSAGHTTPEADHLQYIPGNFLPQTWATLLDTIKY